MTHSIVIKSNITTINESFGSNSKQQNYASKLDGKPVFCLLKPGSHLWCKAKVSEINIAQFELFSKQTQLL